MGDEAIHAVVARLARPRREGGHVIERAAILATGPDAGAIEAWILAHAGMPEQSARPSPRGLHGGRLHDAAGEDRLPRRFVLPLGVL